MACWRHNRRDQPSNAAFMVCTSRLLGGRVVARGAGDDCRARVQWQGRDNCPWPVRQPGVPLLLRFVRTEGFALLRAAGARLRSRAQRSELAARRRRVLHAAAGDGWYLPGGHRRGLPPVQQEYGWGTQSPVHDRRRDVCDHETRRTDREGRIAKGAAPGVILRAPLYTPGSFPGADRGGIRSAAARSAPTASASRHSRRSLPWVRTCVVSGRIGASAKRAGIEKAQPVPNSCGNRGCGEREPSVAALASTGPSTINLPRARDVIPTAALCSPTMT